jgi:hypothetical protein
MEKDSLYELLALTEQGPMAMAMTSKHITFTNGPFWYDWKMDMDKFVDI